jgi:hypothetical protein
MQRSQRGARRYALHHHLLPWPSAILVLTHTLYTAVLYVLPQKAMQHSTVQDSPIPRCPLSKVILHSSIALRTA